LQIKGKGLFFIMMAIDCHFHIGNWKVEEGLSSRLSDLSAIIDSGCLSGAAVMTTDMLENEALLEGIEEMRNDAVYFFYWAVPDNKKDMGFLKRTRAVRGVKIHPSLARKPLTDEGYMEILEAANKRRWPVLVHCGRWEEVSSFRYVLEAAREYKFAKFIVGHFGGQEPGPRKALIEAMASARPENVFIDIAEMTDIWLVERSVSRLGSEKLLLGSDYPFSHPSMYVALVNALNVGGREKENILWRNMAKLLEA